MDARQQHPNRATKRGHRAPSYQETTAHALHNLRGWNVLVRLRRDDIDVKLLGLQSLVAAND